MTTFAQSVRAYEAKCRENGIPPATVMAFLVELSGAQSYDLYARYNAEMPEDLAGMFDAGMIRILKHEPMEYVLGFTWFYGYRLKVNRDVLIPRPETEELCLAVLQTIDSYFKDAENLFGADIGTGSGALAIALAKEEPRLTMIATDISEKAVNVARHNADLNEAKISFMVGDMLAPLLKNKVRLDVLVANPPYIPQREKIDRSVYDYEPHVALFGGPDGLAFYRIILKDCRRVLKEKAVMAFEIGWNQGDEINKLVKGFLPEAGCEVLKDINGKDRILLVYSPGV